MKCRIDIKGQKIWVDDNNSHSTRPAHIEIVLYRDDEVFDTITLDTSGDGKFIFPCLINWKSPTEKYIYRVDETTTPNGYIKTINGYLITNTLENIVIEGVKTWVDNSDSLGDRPAEINLHLFQNGVEIDTLVVESPIAPVNVKSFSFGEHPFADALGVPYEYSITEDAVSNYETTIDGLLITNSHSIVP